MALPLPVCTLRGMKTSFASQAVRCSRWPTSTAPPSPSRKFQGTTFLAKQLGRKRDSGSSAGGKEHGFSSLRPRTKGHSGPACFFSFFGKQSAQPQKAEIEKEGRVTKFRELPLPFPSSMLKSTYLADRPLSCCYRASEDGFSAASFHTHCDFKGPCVIVATADDGLVFGGFNPEGFRSTDDYSDSFEAFLFYLSKEGEAVVLPKVGGSGAALFDYARGGPQFGADGLLLGPPLAPVMGGFSGPDGNDGLGSLMEARSRLGLSYAKRPDGKDSLFGEKRTAVVVEVEVFCSPALAALY